MILYLLLLYLSIPVEGASTCMPLCGDFTVPATAFYKVQPVIEFMKEVFERERGFDLERPLQDFLRRKFAKEIKGNCCQEIIQ